MLPFPNHGPISYVICTPQWTSEKQMLAIERPSKNTCNTRSSRRVLVGASDGHVCICREAMFFLLCGIKTTYNTPSHFYSRACSYHDTTVFTTLHHRYNISNLTCGCNCTTALYLVTYIASRSAFIIIHFAIIFGSIDFAPACDLLLHPPPVSILRPPCSSLPPHPPCLLRPCTLGTRRRPPCCYACCCVLCSCSPRQETYGAPRRD
jgi:hypothetical protein